jgi:heptosyltransferase-1
MSSLGDVIHTLPALTDAARALSGVRFDWVVEEAFAEIPAWHPAVDRVIPVAIRRWRKRPLKNFTGPEWRRARNALRRQHYDAVIDAQGLLKSAFIARLVKATRCGMDKHSVRERLATLAYHHKIPVPRDMHAVERIRLLFARALNYPLPAEPGDYCLRDGLRGGFPDKLAPAGKELPPGLLFFHGTARAEKLWPEDHWVELAALAAEQGYTVWLPWGSDEERARAERIAGRRNASHSNASHSNAGKNGQAQVLPRLDLLGLAGMLLQVSGAVAVDTGLGHLSAALDVPTVSLYGPTRTELIGAYGRNQVHLQSPVGTQDTSDPLAMMKSITATVVWRELQAILPGAIFPGVGRPASIQPGSD